MKRPATSRVDLDVEQPKRLHAARVSINWNKPFGKVFGSTPQLSMDIYPL